MNKKFYIFILLFLLFSCGETDIEKLGIDDNINKKSSIEENNTEGKEIKNDIKKEKVEKRVENKLIDNNIDFEDKERQYQINEIDLLKNGFKLNKLGKINEYYKKNGNEYETIYIQGNKKLYFSVNNNIKKIKIYYPYNEIIDNEIGNNFQPIFKVDNSDGKVIITNLDTIKIINKKLNINKIIWSNKMIK